MGNYWSRIPRHHDDDKSWKIYFHLRRISDFTDNSSCEEISDNLSDVNDSSDDEAPPEKRVKPEGAESQLEMPPPLIELSD